MKLIESETEMIDVKITHNGKELKLEKCVSNRQRIQNNFKFSFELIS